MISLLFGLMFLVVLLPLEIFLVGIVLKVIFIYIIFRFVRALLS